jgi:hypothetical protein
MSINKAQTMKYLSNTMSTPFKQAIGNGSEARKAIDRFLLRIDPAYLAAVSSPDGFSKRLNSNGNAMLDDCPFGCINCPRYGRVYSLLLRRQAKG